MFIYHHFQIVNQMQNLTLTARLQCKVRTQSAGNVLFFIPLDKIKISILLVLLPRGGQCKGEKQRDTKQRMRLSGGKDMRLFSQFALYNIG